MPVVEEAMNLFVVKAVIRGKLNFLDSSPLLQEATWCRFLFFLVRYPICNPVMPVLVWPFDILARMVNVF